MAGGIAGLLILGAAIVSVLGLRYGLLTWHFSQLLEYQLEKLNKARAVDVLVVGDSSLGNAVDARAWSQELRRPVISLALTGTYGYGGSLNMIRRALRRGTPKTIVLFHAVDLMARQESGQGALFTAEKMADLDLVSSAALWDSLVNLAMPLNVAGTLLLSRDDKRMTYVETDYVPQKAPLSATQARPPREDLRPTEFSAQHRRFLTAIGVLCAERNIQCLYVHGPLGEWRCHGSAAFVAAVNQIVRESGLVPVAATPLCIGWSDIGDAVDHVHPAARASFSARYLSLVAPLLDQPSR